MKRAMVCSSILLALGAVTSQAQVTPVVAKQRIVMDTLDSRGNVIRHRETLGIYLRNSTGSTVTKYYSSENGKTSFKTGQLVDYSRRKIYALSFERLQATEQAEIQQDGPHPEYVANARTSLREETVNGLPCLVHQIFMNIDGKEQRVGTTYDSAEYGLTIKSDAIIEPPGGPRTHRVEELYDIQSIEPDAREFSLEKFSVMEKNPASCGKIGATTVTEPLK